MKRLHMTMLVLLLGSFGCTLDFDQFPSEVGEPMQADAAIVDMAPVDMMDDPDIDSDGDGVFDQDDNCPATPNMPQLDLDGDGTGDACDDDLDGDRIPNGEDVCPETSDPLQTDFDLDGTGDACDDDVDGDGILNEADNCPLAPNPDQRNSDRDIDADACDNDRDNDGLPNDLESEIGTSVLRPDSDADGVLDGVDACPLTFDVTNTNTDGDAFGRVCDIDDDDDGVFDFKDNCVGTINPEQLDQNGDGIGDACDDDRDSDGIADNEDNCPYHPNPDQTYAPCEEVLNGYLFDRNIRSFVDAQNGTYVVSDGSIRRIANGQEELLGSGFRSESNRPVRIFVADGGRLFVATESDIFVYDESSNLQFSLMNAEAPESFGAPFTAIAFYNERVWVGNEQGLFRLEDDGWREVSEVQSLTNLFNVREIQAGPQSRLWVIFEDGTAIFEGDELLCGDEFPCPGLQPDATILRGVSRTGDQMWVYSDIGAVRYNFAAVEQDRFRGPEVFGVTGDDDLWVLSSLNLYRVDADRRSLPLSTAPLPASEMSAITTLNGGDTLVGSVNGVRQYESFVSSYIDPVRYGVCLVDSLRINEHLWIASRETITVISPDGEERVIGEAEIFEGIALPTPMQISVLALVDDTVWVGTNHGIAVINPELLTVNVLYQQQIPQAPVTDIVVHPGTERVWVASRGAGLGYLNKNDQTWGTVRTGNGLKSDTVFALAVSNTNVYAATQSGINELNANTTSVTPPGAFDVLNPLASTLSQDVAFDQASNMLFVATTNGLSVRRNSTWSTFQRNGEGLPLDSGTDEVRAVAYDGTSMWLVLRRGEAEFPQGSIVKRSPLLEDGPEFERFLPSEIGMSLTDSSEQIRLNIREGEISISTCGRLGPGEEPGGVTLMPGRRLETQRFSENSLVGTTTDQNRLTLAFGDQPLSTGISHEGFYESQLVTSEGIVPINLPSDVFSGGPSACAQNPLIAGQSVCIFPRSPIEAPPAGGIALGTFANGQVNWATTGANLFVALRDGDLTDVVYDNSGVAWISSRQGLIKYELGGTMIDSLSQANHPELVSENILALAAHNTKLALATDLGLMIYNQMPLADEDEWSQPTGLPVQFESSAVTAVAFGLDGLIYAGTDNGLYVVGADGTYQLELTIADGLLSNVITDLSIHSNGSVYIASEGGLNVYDPMTGVVDSIYFGMKLGGRAVYDLSMTAAGDLWYRTLSGINRL